MNKKSLLLTFFLFCYLFQQAQLISDSINVDGHYRTFHFKQPGTGLSDPALLFIMHGSGGTGKGIRNKALPLETQADTEQLIVVYPDGYKNYWNECRKAATSAANVENIDESAFFSAMINYFRTKYNVDTGKIFAAGFSGGGHMAYKLAMTMPEKFKAVTAVVASLPTSENMDCNEMKKPVAVMIINGTADPTNPYNGGEVKTTGVVLGNVRSTDESFRYWASINGYKGKPARSTYPDDDALDGKTIERYTYKRKGKPEVTLLKVVNGKHDYPGDIDVYIEAWKFCKRQMQRK